VAQGWDPYRDFNGAIPTHPVLRHNALPLKKISCVAHEDPKRKIAFMSLFTVLVPVVIQISVVFPGCLIF
jgi:hypothetical protein